MPQRKTITVIGAGFIGLACAIELQQQGHHVILIDRQQPGHGASFGPACIFANFACFPVSHPQLFRQLPSMLLSHDSPLAIRWSYLPKLLPWALAFIAAGRIKQWQHNTQQLIQLLQHADSATQQLLTLCNAHDLISQQGVVHIYKSLQQFEHKQKLYSHIAYPGFNVRTISADELSKLEPNLHHHNHPAHFFTDGYHTIDSAGLCQRLFDSFINQGGDWIEQSVISIEANSGQTRIRLNNNVSITSQATAICCGSWSKRFCKQLGDHYQLETERGYHVMFAPNKILLTRPVMCCDKGYYLTPLRNNNIRVAGTVELGGLRKAPWQKRIDFISHHARQHLDQLGDVQSSWMGFRPSMPNSIPVISTSKRHSNVVYAFGHGHLGMTLAGITAKLATKQLLPN